MSKLIRIRPLTIQTASRRNGERPTTFPYKRYLRWWYYTACGYIPNGYKLAPYVQVYPGAIDKLYRTPFFKEIPHGVTEGAVDFDPKNKHKVRH